MAVLGSALAEGDDEEKEEVLIETGDGNHAEKSEENEDDDISSESTSSESTSSSSSDGFGSDSSSSQSGVVNDEVITVDGHAGATSTSYRRDTNEFNGMNLRGHLVAMGVMEGALFPSELEKN